MNCAATLGSGSLKLGSVRKLFERCSARSLKSLDGSLPSSRDLLLREPADESKVGIMALCCV